MSLATFITSHIPNPLPSYLTSYQPPLTPLSNGSHVIAALVSYLVTVFSIKFIMKDRKPVQLSLLWQAHNLILSVGSLVLLVLMVEEIVPIVWNRGIFYGICGRDAWTPVCRFILFLLAFSEPTNSTSPPLVTETRILLHD
jgi:fatty acid elongase 3